MALLAFKLYLGHLNNIVWLTYIVSYALYWQKA